MAPPKLEIARRRNNQARHAFLNAMHIDPAALAVRIGAVQDLDPEGGLTATLQQVVMAATTLFGADGAALLLTDADGELRWASATDQRSQLVEEEQERLGRGPSRAAFARRTAIRVRNAGAEPDPDGTRSVLRNAGFRAALSVPVELHGRPIGSLILHSVQPRDWDDSEVGAVQAYAGVLATLIGSAAAAHVKGRLADELQAALGQGAVIEQAKGALMEREHLDAATAYERLRTAARSSNRKVADVARDLLAGAPFPPGQRRPP